MTDPDRRAPSSGPHAPPPAGTSQDRDSPVAVSLDVSAVPDHPAGAGRYTATLAAALATRPEVQLTLLTRTSDAERWTAIAPGARREAVAPDARPARLIWEQVRLPRLLGRLGVQVHHAPHYTMPEVTSLPCVVTIHDLTFFDHPGWHERSKVVVFRRAVRVAAAHAQVLVCVSQTTADRLVALCRPAGRVMVVPHGVDHERFRPDGASGPNDSRSADSLRARLRLLGVRRPYVAFMGTVEPRKDVPTLVRAFDRMCPAHPDLRLVVAGEAGWGERAVSQAVASARHPERILRLGYVPEALVPELLRQAAAVAYPALEEGFGLPVLEALACGTPLVTTSGTVMEEMVDGAALLVEPGDAAALAGALDMLVTRDDGLAARRERGLAVAGRYTWQASAAGHVAAYRVARDASVSPTAGRR